MPENPTDQASREAASFFQSLAEREGMAPSFVRLQEALFQFRRDELKRDATPIDSPAPAVIEEAFGHGRCLAQQVRLIPPPKILHETFQRLLAVLFAHCELPSSFRKWAQGAASADGLLENWLEAMSSKDQHVLAAFAEKSGQDEEILRWVGRELARPFYYQYGRIISMKDLSAWHHGACPCCGGAARMARLEKETGRRHLWCDLCDVQWSFSRVQCPFCGNDDTEQLGNLDVEEQSRYRIAVCQQCEGYLRTIDERQLPEGIFANMPLEDVATLPLDFVARREGYRQGLLDREKENHLS